MVQLCFLWTSRFSGIRPAGARGGVRPRENKGRLAGLCGARRPIVGLRLVCACGAIPSFILADL